MLLIIENESGAPTAVHVRLRDRVFARLHADALDRALAAGASPDANVAVALRARRLTSLRYRQALASGLDRVVHEALARPTAFSPPLDWTRVRPVIADLTSLRRRLLDPLVSAQGVAQVELLLTSGDGPLYRGGPPGALVEAVNRASASLTRRSDALA
jgi:hypothetical protein